jgi:3-oxoacyl-[acyl-carrier protein] reductase
MNILVTGGASGLGESITRKLLADNGNRVYFTYNKSKANALEITSAFSNSISIESDFRNSDSLDNLIRKMVEMDLDILVNNAITSHFVNHFQKIEHKTFQESFNGNVLPTLRITQEAIKIFRAKKFGKIITILTAGLINTPPIGWSEYTANKAYLLSMSKSWATENSKFNVTSNSISPALMMTNLMSDMDERIVETATESHPLKKLLTGNEVADAVAFLASSSQQINGVNLVINSGVNVI